VNSRKRDRKTSPRPLQPEKNDWTLESFERSFVQSREEDQFPPEIGISSESLRALSSEKLRELIDQGRTELQSKERVSEEVMYTEESGAADKIEATLQSLESEATRRGLQIGPRPQTLPETPKPTVPDETPEIAKRRAIVRQNRDKPTLEICKLFDAADYPVPIPPKWDAEYGVRNWVDAYEHPGLHQNVETIVSKDRHTTK